MDRFIDWLSDKFEFAVWLGAVVVGIAIVLWALRFIFGVLF
jgi:hypothetical protein